MNRLEKRHVESNEFFTAVAISNNDTFPVCNYDDLIFNGKTNMKYFTTVEDATASVLAKHPNLEEVRIKLLTIKGFRVFTPFSELLRLGKASLDEPRYILSADYPTEAH